MKNKHILILTLFIFTAACKSEYEQWVSKETATGVRNDSLILGIHLGMSKNDFYRHCLELNRTNAITNGPENSTAQINAPNDSIAINFYPDFYQDKIAIFRMYFNHHQWSPWNKHTYAEKIRPLAIEYLSKTYNTSFREMQTPNGKPFWLSIAGNRQIRVFKKDDKTLACDISDLSITIPHPEVKPGHPKIAE
jgi:hypothetical protein